MCADAAFSPPAEAAIATTAVDRPDDDQQHCPCDCHRASDEDICVCSCDCAAPKRSVHVCVEGTGTRIVEVPENTLRANDLLRLLSLTDPHRHYRLFAAGRKLQDTDVLADDVLQFAQGHHCHTELRVRSCPPCLGGTMERPAKRPRTQDSDEQDRDLRMEVTTTYELHDTNTSWAGIRSAITRGTAGSASTSDSRGSEAGPSGARQQS